MTVHEPATLLTDCLLAVLAGAFAWLLPRENPATRWWRRALGLTALSAFVGGTYHGFSPLVPPPAARAWWTLTLWIIGLLSAAMAMSLVHELSPHAWQRRWTVGVFLLLVTVGSVTFFHPVFTVAIAGYGVILLAWAAAAFLVRRDWSAPMLAGIALSGVAALVQQMRWAPSARFNHNDLYHVIQALALVAFHRAGLKLGRVTARPVRAGS